MNRIVLITASFAIGLASTAQAGVQESQSAAVPFIEVVHEDVEPATKAPKRKSRMADPGEADRAVEYQFVYKDNCLRHTGSRLIRADRGDNQRCAIGNGRVFSREDIDASGQSLDILF